jgi:hypothetical protein
MIKIAVVGERNGKRVVSIQRAFLAVAWLNTVLEIAAFAWYFKEGGTWEGAVPFIACLSFSVAVVLVGFVYWFSIPPQRLPSLSAKNEMI